LRVSASGYYDWSKRLPSARQCDNQRARRPGRRRRDREPEPGGAADGGRWPAGLAAAEAAWSTQPAGAHAAGRAQPAGARLHHAGTRDQAGYRHHQNQAAPRSGVGLNDLLGATRATEDALALTPKRAQPYPQPQAPGPTQPPNTVGWKKLPLGSHPSQDC